MKFVEMQILGMKWLSDIISQILQTMGVDIESRVGASIHFFIYDVIKIFILLSILIFVISYIQSYFPPERTKKILGKFKGVLGNIMGALFGTITPFCSCSSIPLFVGFTSAGLPLGVTFSFLISSPLVDLASVILLASIFGWKVSLAYVFVGLLLAVIGGGIISALHLESQIEEFVLKIKSIDSEIATLNKKQRIRISIDSVKEIIHNVWAYILIGVGIGAIIHNWIPESFINLILGQNKWYSVLLATLTGVPMYADIFGTIPIAEALLAKGVGLGTVLAFMMAVTALSLPSLIMLKKVVKTKLLAVFFFIVVIGILIIGYSFNIISKFLI